MPPCLVLTCCTSLCLEQCESSSVKKGGFCTQKDGYLNPFFSCALIFDALLLFGLVYVAARSLAFGKPIISRRVCYAVIGLCSTSALLSVLLHIKLARQIISSANHRYQRKELN